MARSSSGIMKKKKKLVQCNRLNVRGKSFKPRWLHTGRQSQHRRKLPKVDTNRQEMNIRDEIKLNPSMPQRFEEMFDGKFSGFPASIIVLQDNDNVSRKFQTLRKLSTSPHNNILAFFGAQKDESGRYLFAFEEPMYSLAEYMHDLDVEKLKASWLDMLRGIIQGIKHMHGLNLSHGNINPWNTFVTQDRILKLGGLNNCSKLTTTSRDLDYMMVAKLIAFCFSDLRPTISKDDYMNYTILNFQRTMHPLSKEARVVVKILRKTPRAADVLDDILMQLWLWPAEKRVFFIKEVQEMIFDKKKTFKVKSKNLKVNIAKIDALASKCWNTNIGWVDRFDPDIMQVQDPKKKKQPQRYIGTNPKSVKNRQSVIQLINFMRNLYGHHLEVGRKLKKVCGKNHLGYTIEDLELVYRRAFPDLLVNLYDEMKRQKLNTTSKLERFYSLQL